MAEKMHLLRDASGNQSWISEKNTKDRCDSDSNLTWIGKDNSKTDFWLIIVSYKDAPSIHLRDNSLYRRFAHAHRLLRRSRPRSIMVQMVELDEPRARPALPGMNRIGRLQSKVGLFTTNHVTKYFQEYLVILEPLSYCVRK